MRKRALLGSLILALSLLVASQGYAAAPPHSSAPVAHATAQELWRAFLSALGLAPRALGTTPAITTQGDSGGGADPDGRVKVSPTSDARGGADPDGK